MDNNTNTNQYSEYEAHMIAEDRHAMERELRRERVARAARRLRVERRLEVAR